MYYRSRRISLGLSVSLGSPSLTTGHYRRISDAYLYEELGLFAIFVCRMLRVDNERMVMREVSYGRHWHLTLRTEFHPYLTGAVGTEGICRGSSIKALILFPAAKTSIMS